MTEQATMETSDDDRRLAEIEAVLRTVPYHPDGNRLYLDDDDVKVIDGIRQIGLELLAMARAAVAERLPEQGVNVLGCFNLGGIGIVCFANGDWIDDGLKTMAERNAARPKLLEPIAVTHWRPMPAAPSPG